MEKGPGVHQSQQWSWALSALLPQVQDLMSPQGTEAKPWTSSPLALTRGAL